MKKSGFAQRIAANTQQRVEEARRHSRIFMLDMVAIALGRMGFRETKFREFDKVLNEVCDEYSKLILDDSTADFELVYSKAYLDRELKQYTGKMFADYDSRYAGVLK